MKKFTLLILVMLLGITGVNAKTVTTTLWEGTDTGAAIELNAATVATFKEGDVLRVDVTVPGGGANFGIWYNGAPEWQETAIPSINNKWPWVNGGETYKDFALTAADITAISGKNIYISKGANSTITKVSLITVELDEQTLYDESTAMGGWTSIGEDELTPTMFANVKEGDKIVVNASASDGGQVWIAKLTEGYAEENLLDGASITDNVSYTLSAGDANFIKARGIRLKGKNFTLSSIGLIPVSVKAIISSTGIGTFCSSKVLDFTGTGVTPYYASDVDKGTVTLTSVEKTASNTGYILKGSEGVYAIPVIVEEVTAPTTNYLKATGDNSAEVAASTGSTFHYIFAKEGDDASSIGFYKLTAAHTLAAHKAYLKTTDDITPTELARAIRLVFDGNNITDINTIEEKKVVTKNDGITYNLNGQVVTNPSKGIYIKNGKKFVIE